MDKHQSLLTLLFSVFALAQLGHGLYTGNIIIHGYNRSTGGWNRANRDSQPTTFWGYVIFYIVLILAMWGLAIAGVSSR